MAWEGKMLIQRAIISEKAVDFLFKVLVAGELEILTRSEIKRLLRKIKWDIAQELSEWKASDEFCGLVHELGCENSVENCKAGNCPFLKLGEEFDLLFTKKLNRLTRKIRSKFIYDGPEKEEKEDVPSKEKLRQLQIQWSKTREADKTRLAVKNAREKVVKALEQTLIPFGTWMIKTRKRKKDGKIILNINFRQEYLSTLPISLQVKCLELRTPMRTADELVEKIHQCDQALRFEMELQKKAKKKRKRNLKKQRKKLQRKNEENK